MLIQFNSGVRLLLDAAGDIVLSSENPFDFHADTMDHYWQNF